MTLLHQRYKLKKQLAEGEAIHTWLAEDIQTKQICVVKGLSLQQTDAWKTLELFEREAKILSNLNHPQIPRYLDSFKSEASDTFYLVQAHIQGQNLEQRIEGGRFFTEKDVIAMAKSLLKVLDYLHQFSPPIIHRDIKPSNIMMADSGDYYLIDFGAVREKAHDLKQTKTIVGTFGYMPIEQFEGKASAASDIYSLGMTLIYVLSHEDPTMMDKQDMAIQFRPHVNISEPFAQVLEKMVAPDVTKRYQKVTDVLVDLQNFSATPAKKSHKPDTPPTRVPATPFPWFKAGGVAMGILVLLGYCTLAKKQSPNEIAAQVSEAPVAVATASAASSAAAPFSRSSDLMVTADAYWKKEAYRDALSAYTDVLAKDSRSFKAYFRRSFCYGKQDQHDLALVDLQKVIELAPIADKDFLPYALYNMAWNYTKLNQHEKAIEWFGRSLQNTSEPEDVYNMRGLSYLALKQPRPAEQDFLKAIQTNPKLHYPYNNLGRIYHERSQWDKALSYYDRAIAVDPKYALPHYNKGRLYRQRQQPDLAIQEFTNAVTLSKNYPEAYLERGQLYQQQKQYDLALKDYNSTLEYDTKSAEALFYRGQIHRLQKNCGLSQADFKKACQMGQQAACRSTCP